MGRAGLASRHTDITVPTKGIRSRKEYRYRVHFQSREKHIRTEYIVAVNRTVNERGERKGGAPDRQHQGVQLEYLSYSPNQDPSPHMGPMTRGYCNRTVSSEHHWQRSGER